MQKNMGISTQMRKNMKMGGSDSWAQGVGIPIFSVWDAIWLHFGPGLVSRPHLELKMMRKWTPEDLKVTTKL